MDTPTSTEAPTATPIETIAPKSGDSESGDNEETSPRVSFTEIE